MSMKYGILKKANVDHIRKAINNFLWEKSFQNINVNDMVHLFNRTIKYILHSFISYEIRFPLKSLKRDVILVYSKN